MLFTWNPQAHPSCAALGSPRALPRRQAEVSLALLPLALVVAKEQAAQAADTAGRSPPCPPAAALLRAAPPPGKSSPLQGFPPRWALRGLQIC